MLSENKSFIIKRNTINLNISKSDTILDDPKSYIAGCNIKESLSEKENGPEDNFNLNYLNTSANMLEFDKINIIITDYNNLLINAGKELTCPVCYSTFTNSNDTYTFRCGHYFCTVCITDFLIYCVTENKLDKIKCLDHKCEGRIQELELNLFLSDEILSKYFRFIKNNKITDEGNSAKQTPCPYPDCEEWVIADQDNLEGNYYPSSMMINKMTLDETEALRNDYMSKIQSKFGVEITDIVTLPIEIEKGNVNEIVDPHLYSNLPNINNFLICPKGHKFCKQCNKFYWHFSQNCVTDDLNFFKFYQENNIEMKNCPQCNIWTEKTIGCNHIKCTNCKFEWCWLCLSLYTHDHYSNPDSSCKGKMYEGSNVTFLQNNNGLNILLENPNYDFELRNLVRERIAAIYNQQHDNYELGKGDFKTLIIFYPNSCVRLLHAICILMFILFTNFAIYRKVSNYLDRKLPYVNRVNFNFRNYFFLAESTFLTILVIIMTYFIGFIISIGVYFIPLIRYVSNSEYL